MSLIMMVRALWLLGAIALIFMGADAKHGHESIAGAILIFALVYHLAHTRE